jgi:RimJ/RimL family protein N-acetyltransferase
MTIPLINLCSPTIEDIHRVSEWLRDSQVSESWYGVDENGKPLHIGYDPVDEILKLDGNPLGQVLTNSRKIWSIYAEQEGHIGEGQLVVEWSLQEAQLFLLVGRKDLWHHHYGTSALIRLLDEAFDKLELHRVWVDVPEYNEHALRMVQHLGFVLEGHLRSTHKKNDTWYDSSAMGLLAPEYARRRARAIADV